MLTVFSNWSLLNELADREGMKNVVFRERSLTIEPQTL